MDEYVRKMYPASYRLAEEICAYLADFLKLPVAPPEITLLAIHIQRVL